LRFDEIRSFSAIFSSSIATFKQRIVAVADLGQHLVAGGLHHPSARDIFM